MRKRWLSLLLAILLVLFTGTGAFADYYDNLVPDVRTVAPDYAGKTIILHTNDVHGNIANYAYLPALKEQYLGWGASDVLIVDAGDFSQGETYVSLNKGKAAIDMMNAAGYNVVALGNHEFDYGTEQLLENLKGAQFSAVCCNVFLEETGETLLPPSAVVQTASGLKVGFVGITTPETAAKVNPGMIRQISFSLLGQLYPTVQAAVDAISEDCDVVIALAHLGVEVESASSGYRSVDLLNTVEGIDFVVDGHSHTVMTSARYGLPVQSTGKNSRYIGVIVIDDATGIIEDNYLLSAAELTMDKATAAIAQEIIDDIDSRYNTPFATSEVNLIGDKIPVRTGETNLGDLVADAMVWYVVKEGGIEQVEPNAVVGITNAGSIRASIVPGDITMKNINDVLPYGNTLAVVYVTGQELLEALEASTWCAPESIGGFPQTSGIRWTLNTAVPYDKGDVYTLDGKESSYFAPATISRVTIEAINGEPFDPEATYAVVTQSFCAAGGDTYNAFNRAYVQGADFDTGVTMDQAMIDYITTELDGVITEEMYGASGSRLTLLLPEETGEEAKPAA